MVQHLPSELFLPPLPSFKTPKPPPQVDPQDEPTVAVCVNREWLPYVLGALQQLIEPTTWAGTQAEKLLAQERAQLLITAFATEQCNIAPYWDDDDGDDATGNEPQPEDFPWYENLADFVVTAFLATSFTPEAAIQFVTTARKLRLWFRRRDYGAILRILLDDEEIGTVDTYSPEPDIIEFPYDIPALEGFAAQEVESWRLRIEHTGTANENAVPINDTYGMEVIRKHIQWSQESQLMLRQNPSDPCQLQQSLDGGETWTLAFDYGLCVPGWAQALIDGVNGIQGTLWDTISDPGLINTNAPTSTWVWKEGESSSESEYRVAALCYAARYMIDVAFELLIRAYDGQITLLNLADVVLSILQFLEGGFGWTVWYPMAVALATTALEEAQQMVETDIEILQDGDVRSALACLLLTSLQAKPVSSMSFGTALQDQEDVCFDSDIQRALVLLNDMLSNVPQRQAMYTGFVDALGSGYVAAKAGLIPEPCICPTDSWQYCLPLGEWLNYAQPDLPTVGGCTNLKNSIENGWQPYDLSGTPVWSTSLVNCGGANVCGRSAATIKIFVPSGTTVDYVAATWQSLPTAGTNSDSVTKMLRVNANQSCFGSFPSNPISLSSLGISGEEMEIYISFGDANVNRAWAITKIELQGTGVPLFGLCDNC